MKKFCSFYSFPTVCHLLQWDKVFKSSVFNFFLPNSKFCLNRMEFGKKLYRKRFAFIPSFQRHTICYILTDHLKNNAEILSPSNFYHLQITFKPFGTGKDFLHERLEHLQSLLIPYHLQHFDKPCRN